MQRRQCALVKAAIHTSHSTVLVRQIAQIAGTARAVPGHNVRLTGTVVVVINPKMLLNEGVTRAAKGTEVPNIRLAAKRDRGH